MLEINYQASSMVPLKNKGFEHFFIETYNLDVNAELNLKKIQHEFDKLSRDRYGEEDNRFRSYARGVLLPWKAKFEWIPPTQFANGQPSTEYYQGPYNPEFSGERRLLPAISDEMRSNPLLCQLISENFGRTFWPETLWMHPLQVGVSFIKLQVDVDHRRALSTPDSFHQDGETFTFAHLVKREGIIGGINAIADPSAAGKVATDVPREQLLAEFQLCRPLESYAIFDPLVSHYISPIELESGHSRGERSIVLIDFTPMVPLHHAIQ